MTLTQVPEATTKIKISQYSAPDVLTYQRNDPPSGLGAVSGRFWGGGGARKQLGMGHALHVKLNST